VGDKIKGPKSIIEAYGLPKTQKLFEKWGKKIKAVRKAQSNFSDSNALKLARVLENTKREITKAERTYEGTQPVDVGPFKKYAFDILTALMPNLIAEDLVSVQPMDTKVGRVFYLRYLYGSDKGNISAGDTMFGPYQVGPKGYDASKYSSEYVENEILATPDDYDDDDPWIYTGNIAYVPIRPGYIVIDTGTVQVTDDGDGNLEGTGVTGTIDYESGAYTLEYTVQPQNDLIAEYQYDLEHAPSTIPEVTVRVDERIITARARKLKALYAFDAAYDLQQEQGIDLDDALLETITTEIKHEIDGEVMLDLYNQAGIQSEWDITIPSPELSQKEHYESFIAQLSADSNSIFQETRRAVGNFIVVGKTAADVLEALGEPRYTGQTTGVQAGPHQAGVLDNKWNIYKNPYYNEDEYLVGYKGDLFLDAGYVLAPYLPVFATQLLMMEDFVGRRGFATSNGKRMLNNKLYVKGTVEQSEKTDNWGKAYEESENPYE